MGALTAKKVAGALAPGRYPDGNNLYLQVTKSGGKSWIFRYVWQKKRKALGLGPFPSLGLADAREQAHEALRLLKDRSNPQDPMSVRRLSVAAVKQKPQFGKFADELIQDIQHEWRNAKHADQWRATLVNYCKSIWETPVDEIGTEDILKILRPIWRKKPETGRRLRGRIERVLDAAAAREFRTAANPARWRGHLANLLARPSKTVANHHPAMPYDDISDFVQRLHRSDGMSARGLEFLILTAARSGEVIGMRWEEVDSDRGVWTIPAGRMKAGREHRVPLSWRAVQILHEMRPLSLVQVLATGDEIAVGPVFRGPRGGSLSDMAFLMTMRKMKLGHYVPHGFRSSFRDWCGEETEFARETAEAALAHVVGDATERAYRRSDALEKRRKLMNAWAEFVCGVAPIAPEQAHQVAMSVEGAALTHRPLLLN